MAAIFRFAIPYTPNLIPLAVFLLSLPVIAFMSISAGWLVWRSVAVAWEAELYLQYGDGVPPYAEFYLPYIATKQPYDISLHLTVPATEPNIALGNFMTTLTLITPSNRTLAYVRKPAIVLPRSSAPWSFLYNWPGTVDLRIIMLKSFAIEASRAIARVEIGRKDQWRSLWNGEGREISVLTAVLRGSVVHKGIRGLIARFPLISALIATLTFMFISFVVLASCLLPGLEMRFDSDPHANDPPPPRRRRPTRPRPSSGVVDTPDERSTRKPKTRRRSSEQGVPEPPRYSGMSSPTQQEEQVKTEEPHSSIELDPLDPELSMLRQHSEPIINFDGSLEQLNRFRFSGSPPMMGTPAMFQSEPPLRRRRSRSSLPSYDADADADA
ncbi:hypothetical protein WOLCODRAFT_94101 [Wolfiporia cocos MD-104 SS10]|uniref:Adipose-regulatory protein n=1 Tax=Wolfiporia cocos (strain MD-104) TaxID=742152 RepID=A0A2H3IUU9_WOLCO|nr:hypothetical protein WOLCODRAFT_94101 [Wolfiporia cocos MD-104 SS10]